jgi:hypothetical protein
MANSKGKYCCPNCGTLLPVTSKFCHHCGQKHIHPEDHSVWHLIVDSVGDFFHVDSKFFATLRPLFFRPGFLTNEYLQGKRARYFQPFKLFLFISFLYFLTSGLMNQKESNPDPGLYGIQNKEDSNGITKNTGSYKIRLNEAYDKALAIPDDSLRKMVKKHGLNRFVYIHYPGASWLGRFLIKQMIKNRLEGAVTFGENMHKTLPKLIFILIPFIALLLKLLYVRKKIPYFNHIIFSLHFLSFVFFILWINEFGSLVVKWLDVVVYILLMGYLFFGLLTVYRQKKWMTFAKFLLLFFGSLVMLIVFFLLAASISFILI